jgi:hypothetical protein
MKYGRNALISGVITVLLLAVTMGACGQSSTFTFAVVGDRTGRAVEGVFEEILGEVGFVNPDLIITVGDHIEGYSPDSAATEGEWDYVVSLLEATKIEYHLTPGNHDIWDSQSRNIYTRRFGSPDTAFMYRNSLFVIVDVSTDYSVDALPVARIEWLEGVLSAADDDANVFVFYHKPFWCEDFSFGRPHLFHELFKRYNVKAVFTGHYHRHFYTERDGIRYFGVSSSGGRLAAGGREKGCFYAYLLAKVVGESLTVKLVEPDAFESADVVTMGDAVRIAGLETGSVSLSEIRAHDLVAEGTGKITVTIRNQSELTWRDTATWAVSGDWTVEPLRDYVEVPPGETGTLTAFVTPGDDLFPVPSFGFRVPLGDGSRVDVVEPLRLRRELVAQRADSAPAMDGVLDEAVWASAQAETTFYGRSSPDRLPDGTSLNSSYHAEYLYVGVECWESRIDEIGASVRERDGFGAYDDYVSLLLEPRRGSSEFFQISVNPIGTVFDRRIEICPFGTYVLHPEWDIPVEAGTRMLDDRWVVEMAISLTALGHDTQGPSSWGLNFRRMQSRTGVTTEFQSPVWYDSDRMGLLHLP